MNLKNKIIKKNVLNLKKIEYSKWNKKIFKYLLFLIINDNYKKYHDLLLIIYDEFIFFNEHGGGNIINVDNLKQVRNKLKLDNDDDNKNIINFYENLEKENEEKEYKEKIKNERKFYNELKCSEHKFDNFNFESMVLDILDFKFISFGIAFFIIFFICFVKNLFCYKSNFEKKNIFEFKIPLEDNIFVNNILKYFLGNNFNSI